jgi:CRISPR/Cas system CSM-associated protein Csm5 (group 7 of RAMP superfamily)
MPRHPHIGNARASMCRVLSDFHKGEIPMNNENLTLHFKVKDFNAWQTSYNGNEKNRTSAGITKSKVFRSTDDPNDVLLLQDVSDVSKARTWYSSSEMKSVMEKSGVVGSPIIRAAA